MLRTIDLFCGCGGLSLGFQNAGFNIMIAYDNWKKAVDVYNTNFSSHKAVLKDISYITAEEIKQYNPDIIIGGPPCQDYSSAGQRDESKGRAYLTNIFAEVVCSVGVRWFVMENVDRILKSNTLPQIIDKFKKNGYGLTQIILDASKCGVPQKRKRFFLLGELGGKDHFLEDKLVSGQAVKSMTIRDYLGDEFETEFYYRHPRSYARRGIFSIDEPSPTIRGVNRPIPKTYKFHKGDATKDLTKVRALTSLERARIQTFPKDFIFEGTKTDLEQMIGNAVPVNLANYVAERLKVYIKNNLM